MKNIIKSVFILVFLILSSVGNSQIVGLNPEVVSTSGGEYMQTLPTIGNMILSFNVGEPMGESFFNSSSLSFQWITQGFEQPEVLKDTSSALPDSVEFFLGFTPNGDNINDLWIIKGISKFPLNSVAIFNRWGDLIWDCKDYDNVTDGKVWNGTFSKTGQPLPDATYFYILKALDKTRKGFVELTH